MSFDNEWKFRDCPHCGVREAQMNLVGNANTEVKRAGKPGTYWSILSCPRCGGVVAIEHFGPNHQGQLRVIPEPGEGSIEFRHLPDGIAQTYSDAVRVLHAGVPSAAAVLLRRTLEGAAAHSGITERTLVKSIEKMIEQGLVTPSFAKVLHHVRLVGNQGAHYTDEPLSENQVQQALRFTSALLRNVFEVPGDLAELEQDSEAEVSPEGG